MLQHYENYYTTVYSRKWGVFYFWYRHFCSFYCSQNCHLFIWKPKHSKCCKTSKTSQLLFIFVPFFVHLCSELCGFSQTISIQIIHVSMYYLWRFFIHKLIRIPNFWSMRTRMREDADKDGPSGLTSRMNKIL